MLVLVLVLVVVAVLALVVAVVVMVLMVPLVVLVVSRNASQVVCVSCIGYFDRSCYLVCGLVKGILSTCKVSGIAAARVHCFALTFVGHVCHTPRRRYFFYSPHPYHHSASRRREEDTTTRRFTTRRRCRWRSVKRLSISENIPFGGQRSG